MSSCFHVVVFLDWSVLVVQKLLMNLKKRFVALVVVPILVVERGELTFPNDVELIEADPAFRHVLNPCFSDCSLLILGIPVALTTKIVVFFV